jgi:translation initiation factor 1A
MPKNKGKGGKTRKRGKNKGTMEMNNKKDIMLKEEGQEYASVLRMLGNGRLEAYCFGMIFFKF